jgi:four helix bundle protein
VGGGWCWPLRADFASENHAERATAERSRCSIVVLQQLVTGMNRRVRLVEQCYALTRRFPDFELYGLSNQIRRAAVSTPSNVAEGACRRGSTRAFLNHVSIALDSHGELETCVAIAGTRHTSQVWLVKS